MSRVSVLIPNYNNARFLTQCLDSVQAQTHGDWQAVVGDNASTDDSVAIVERMADRRIRLVRRPRTIGWVGNVNLLLAEAGDAEYIAVLHADDWWEPTFLRTTLGLLDPNPASILATSAVRLVRNGQAIGVRGLHEFRGSQPTATCDSVAATRALTRRSCIYAAGVLARADLYRRLGGYEESLPQACDWFMWLRAAAEASVEVCDVPLANYRIHDGNLTTQLASANLFGIDLVRLVLSVRTAWQGGEPFPGANRQLATTVVAELLADAARRALQGDRSGAMMQARLARAIAPAIDQVMLASLGAWALRAAGWPVLRRAQRPLLTIGRLAWRTTQGSAPATRA